MELRRVRIQVNDALRGILNVADGTAGTSLAPASHGGNGNNEQGDDVLPGEKAFPDFHGSFFNDRG
ncbi:MAG: hypothetical protein JSS84_00680 [Bacteroidetes bacterium]|nr:hypothetical protein [Bacteroidota bacterium]